MPASGCTRRVDCTNDCHWWNCLAGIALWRTDRFTTTTDAAAFHAAREDVQAQPLKR